WKPIRPYGPGCLRGVRRLGEPAWIGRGVRDESCVTVRAPPQPETHGSSKWGNFLFEPLRRGDSLSTVMKGRRGVIHFMAAGVGSLAAAMLPLGSFEPGTDSTV